LSPVAAPKGLGRIPSCFMEASGNGAKEKWLSAPVQLGANLCLDRSAIDLGLVCYRRVWVLEWERCPDSHCFYDLGGSPGGESGLLAVVSGCGRVTVRRSELPGFETA